jgi:hypothetical protein
MPYGTVNADVITTSTAGGILGAGNASIMKNRIINGAMVISQRNGTSAVNNSNNTYTLDRWKMVTGLDNKFTVAQSTTAPSGFSNSLLVTSSSAYSVPAGEYYLIGQYIEGYNVADLAWGTASAKNVTVSFQVQSSLTGTFGGCIVNGGAYNYPFTYTISAANTWTTISVAIPAPTSGWTYTSTTNGVGLQIFFNLGTGSTYSGPAGAWASSSALAPTGAVSVVGTNGATLYITGVQLEVGSSATGFEYRLYNQELSACQRYCYVISDSGSAPAFASAPAYNSTTILPFIPFPVTPRTPPTGITATGSYNYYQNGTGYAANTPTYNNGSVLGCEINSTNSGSAWTSGYSGSFRMGNGKIIFTGMEL